MDQLLIQIPAELFALAESSRFEGEVQLDSLALGPDEYSFPHPIAWEVDITNTGSAFLVMGAARADAVVACSRCLDDVELQLEGAIEGYFLLDGEEADCFGEDEDAPGADEFDVLPEDHRIDLLPLIKAALMVEMPTLPLCSEECAGLCPTCGANLNRETCDCAQQQQAAADESNPFSKLADYRFAEN